MKLVRRRLGDVAQIVGGATPSTKVPEYWDGDVPWITPKDLSNFNGIYIGQGARNISGDGLAHSSAKILPIGTVLYTSRAPIGYVAIAGTPVATNQGFKSLILNEGYVPEFVFYLLKNSKQEIESHASGGTFAEISAKAMAQVELDFPEEKYQIAISQVLLNLDEKILNNNSLAKTLEEIAQTIFKSWFIDFDPVKAKMAGEKPVGMDDATAALFPDSMEDSELGPIPKGWNFGSVGDVAQVIDCLHSKKPELVHQGQPYLQLDTIHDDGILRFERAAQISDADYQKWTSRIEVHDGDCVITNVGRVGAVSQVPSHFKGAIGRNITAIRPTDGKYSKTFLAIALTSSFMKREIRTNTDSGTILEALNVRSIPKLRLPIASAQIFELFEELCGPMQAQRHNLHRQNVQLAGIRDSLLPRLISGELQIPEGLLVS